MIKRALITLMVMLAVPAIVPHQGDRVNKQQRRGSRVAE